MKEMLDKYAAAVRAKDVDAFVGLYADDVRTFDLWSVWSYDGKAAFREVVAEWFGSLGTDVVEVEFDEVRSEAGDGVAAGCCCGAVALASNPRANTHHHAVAANRSTTKAPTSPAPEKTRTPHPAVNQQPFFNAI